MTTTTKNSMNFMLLDRLDQRCTELASTLLKSSNKASKHVNYQIELLEVLTYEIKRFDHVGYCDFELAYLCFHITDILLKECKAHPTPEIKDFISVIDLTISKKQSKVQALQTYMKDNIKAQNGPLNTPEPDSDPLLSRFNKLNSPSPSQSPGLNMDEQELIEQYKYSEVITVQQLHNLLSTGNKDVSVLLIDFRTKKEFNYNHINYRDVVNIEPAVVNSLLTFDNDRNTNDVTDQDLEERLRLLLPDEQYQMFQQRHKYDLVVIYNLKYGVAKASFDRFELLIQLIINGDVNGNPSKNPFVKLIDLLTYRNKYISSKLKRHPCYLSGGVTFWFSNNSSRPGIPVNTSSWSELRRGASHS